MSCYIMNQIFLTYTLGRSNEYYEKGNILLLCSQRKIPLLLLQKTNCLQAKRKHADASISTSAEMNITFAERNFKCTKKLFNRETGNNCLDLQVLRTSFKQWGRKRQVKCLTEKKTTPTLLYRRKKTKP